MTKGLRKLHGKTGLWNRARDWQVEDLPHYQFSTGSAKGSHLNLEEFSGCAGLKRAGGVDTHGLHRTAEVGVYQVLPNFSPSFRPLPRFVSRCIILGNPK
jgi:hypothetical protein